ncbi:MAG: hypothetical protein AAF682_03395 [Planctomycetota bacterium]
MSSPDEAREARPRAGLGKVLVRLGLSLLAGLVLLEVAMRVVLFVDVPGLQKLSVRMRQPDNFYAKFEPEYWTTSVRFKPPERLRPNPGYDPVTGWLGQRIESGTYAHQSESLILSRRPVLLFGDSFAQCTTAQRDCWEGLLARSDLDRDYLLLNYGVGGFGFDQTYLLMRGAVDRFREQNPVVIVSVLVDDDLDRIVLPFRGWPKPLFGLEGGELIEPETVAPDTQAYIEQHAPPVWSWSWRYLLHGTRLLPRSWRADPEDVRERIRELTHALLRAIQAHLDARGVDWFVLLFHGKSSLTPGAVNQVWEHDFLIETLREMEIPYISSRRALVEHRLRTKTEPPLYFFTGGVKGGHYTPLGNEAVFPAILRGISGDFD